MSRKPGSGRDGNVVLIGIAGVALIILLGFGLPRLLQRREPGLETAKTEEHHDSEHADTPSKKKRVSVFSDEEEPEAHAEKSASADKHDKNPSSKHAVAQLAEHGAGLEAEAEEHEVSEAPARYSQRQPAAAVRAGKVSGHGSESHDAESGDLCMPLEEPGRPAADIKLTQKAWLPVVEDFRAAKRGIVEWIKKHPAQFPAKKLEEVTARVMDLQIQRPPSQDEADLAWRGGVVLSRMPDGQPILRVGGGFLALHSKDPARARFELARAAAMTLAPCELAPLGLAATWESALSCSKGYIKEGCELGSFSNHAWLIGSAIASETQAPGCRILAVDKSGFLGCLSGAAPLASSHEERVPVGMAALGREIASESKGSSVAHVEKHAEAAAHVEKHAEAVAHVEKHAEAVAHVEKHAEAVAHVEKHAEAVAHVEKHAEAVAHVEKHAEAVAHVEKHAEAAAHVEKHAEAPEPKRGIAHSEPSSKEKKDAHSENHADESSHHEADSHGGGH